MPSGLDEAVDERVEANSAGLEFLINGLKKGQGRVNLLGLAESLQEGVEELSHLGVSSSKDRGDEAEGLLWLALLEERLSHESEGRSFSHPLPILLLLLLMSFQ
jgi:hypothetical protein